MRLFVDCDDTLVRWLGEDGQPLEGQNPYGGGAERWEFNAPLVASVVRFANEKRADVVVWSGGGADYARVWASRLGWEHFVEGWASKDPRLVTADDVCVDDAPIRTAGRLLTPDEFVAEWPTEAIKVIQERGER